MKLFSVTIIISAVFSAKSQEVTSTKPYEPPIPPPLECQTRRKITVDNGPWFLDLYFLQENGMKELDPSCAASLISDRVAVAKEYCVPKYTLDDDKGRNLKNEYYVRPADSINEDDFRREINRTVHKGLVLLYLDKPVCADKVCRPPEQEFYEWSHCFAVGRHEIPSLDDDNYYNLTIEEKEEFEESLPCEIHYNNDLELGMEWSKYSSTKSTIHLKGNKDMGTCVVKIGSPLMCATKSSPNHYFQAGVVVNRTFISAVLDVSESDETDVNFLEYLCLTGNYTQIPISCPKINDIDTVDICHGFDVLNIGTKEIKNWIEETIKEWTNSEGPLAWKPLCKNAGAVEVQYNEFPWIAAIFNSDGKSSSRGSYVCTATVIHPQMALTRRECIESFNDVKQLRLVTGVRTLDHVREYGSHQERQLHDYEKLSKKNSYKEDMVIINWIKALENMDGFPQLAQDGEVFVNKTCLTLGWGLSSRKIIVDEPTYQATLKKAEVPTYDTKTCYIKLASSVYRNLSPEHLEGYICAGGKHPTDVCLVDNGSPLVCQRDKHTPVLVGVLTAAPGCGLEDTPSIYNSIGKNHRKINKTMKVVKGYLRRNNTKCRYIDLIQFYAFKGLSLD